MVVLLPYPFVFPNLSECLSYSTKFIIQYKANSRKFAKFAIV